MNSDKVLKVRNLHITYDTGSRKHTAVKNISFDVNRGEILGLVGESGSGKTTIGKAIAGIVPIAGGNVYFNDKLIFGPTPKVKKNLSVINREINYIKHNFYTIYRLFNKIINNMHNNISTETLKNLNLIISKTVTQVETVWDSLTAFASYLNEASLIDRSLLVKHHTVFVYATNALEFSINSILLIKTDLMYINYVIDNKIDAKAKLKKKIKNLFSKIEDHHSKQPNINEINKAKDEIVNIRKQYLDEVVTILNNEIFKKYEVAYDSLVMTINTLKILKYILIKSPNYANKILKLKSIVPKYNEGLRDKLNDLIKKSDAIYESISHSNTCLADVIAAIEDIDVPKKSTWYHEKKDIQMIFQDPTSSLNSHMTVRDIVAEGMRNYPDTYRTTANKAAAAKDFTSRKNDIAKSLAKEKTALSQFKDHSSKEYKISLKEYNKQQSAYKKMKMNDDYLLNFVILNLLDKVGLLPEHLNRYPHEFSGGQRQRIGIARAIALHPSLIIADEPISALDMSIRSQILNLFNKFHTEIDFACIFITHDLNAAKYITNRIAVIYHGSIVEIAAVDEIFNNPIHPYTKHLLEAIPKLSNKIAGSSYTQDNIKYEYSKIHYDYHIDPPQYFQVNSRHTVYLNKREMQERNK